MFEDNEGSLKPRLRSLSAPRIRSIGQLLINSLNTPYISVTLAGSVKSIPNKVNIVIAKADLGGELFFGPILSKKYQPITIFLLFYALKLIEIFNLLMEEFENSYPELVESAADPNDNLQDQTI